MRIPRFITVTLVLLSLTTACTATTAANTSVNPDTQDSKTPKALTWQLVSEYRHNPASFTQGLETLDSDTVIESNGLYGHSNIQINSLKTGETLHQTELAKEYFGEGITRVKDHFISFTWKNHKAYTWSNNLEKTSEVAYPQDGWGACFDEQTNTLWTSDGSTQLVARDPETLQEKRHITVNFKNQAQNNLNELECLNGKIWANIWLTNTITEIDPATGNTTSYLDLSLLAAQAEETNVAQTGKNLTDSEVLNGITVNKTTGNLLVTGKHWPRIYEIKLNR